MYAVYDRETGQITEKAPMGTFGQISLSRLCTLMEETGEVRPHEKITHLILHNSSIKYRIESSNSPSQTPE